MVQCRRVNRMRTNRIPKSLRAVALIMALICLGISGGTTLVHTDDLGSLRTFHAGRDVLAHAVTGGERWFLSGLPVGSLRL